MSLGPLVCLEWCAGEGAFQERYQSVGWILQETDATITLWQTRAIEGLRTPSPPAAVGGNLTLSKATVQRRIDCEMRDTTAESLGGME